MLGYLFVSNSIQGKFGVVLALYFLHATQPRTPVVYPIPLTESAWRELQGVHQMACDLRMHELFYVLRRMLREDAFVLVLAPAVPLTLHTHGAADPGAATRGPRPLPGKLSDVLKYACAPMNPSGYPCSRPRHEHQQDSLEDALLAEDVVFCDPTDATFIDVLNTTADQYQGYKSQLEAASGDAIQVHAPLAHRGASYRMSSELLVRPTSRLRYSSSSKSCRPSWRPFKRTMLSSRTRYGAHFPKLEVNKYFFGRARAGCCPSGRGGHAQCRRGPLREKRQYVAPWANYGVDLYGLDLRVHDC